MVVKQRGLANLHPGKQGRLHLRLPIIVVQTARRPRLEKFPGCVERGEVRVPTQGFIFRRPEQQDVEQEEEATGSKEKQAKVFILHGRLGRDASDGRTKGRCHALKAIHQCDGSQCYDGPAQ